MSEQHTGIVKWFNNAKGFGFIEHKTGQDVFVHYSVIETDGFKTLKDGEEVTYELSEGDKGLHAIKVARTNAAPAESASLAAEVSVESENTSTEEAGHIAAAETSPDESIETA